MYEMDLYCNSFSLLDPWEKCGSFRFSLGVYSTDTAAVTRFRGASCLVEDEHLRKRVISGGSATFCHELAAVAIRGPNVDRPSCLYPRLI